jgi:hypothetical protein
MDGITFASMAEMNRYAELRMLEKAGLISDLELQPSFILQPKFVHSFYGLQRAIIYKADFGYKEKGNRRRVVEDVKGFMMKDYIIKKKILLYTRPDIDFREVKARR